MQTTRKRIVLLVTGNSSWWKERKYRREAARALKQLRARGWRYIGKRRLPQPGVDTRRFTEYTLSHADDLSA